jgi:hypothetical protein
MAEPMRRDRCATRINPTWHAQYDVVNELSYFDRQQEIALLRVASSPSAPT